MHRSDTSESIDPVPAAGQPPRSDFVWGTCILAAATVLLYWPTPGFDFVSWDDPWYVQNNQLIRSWHPDNLYGIATRTVSRNFAPLTVFSFLVDHTVWGLNPAGYHATNVLLHLINGLLVFVLITRLSGSRLVGFSTALLFVVHPVQVESVAWISARKGLLAAAMMLGSLIFWLRPDRTARAELAGLAFFIGALLAKALAVVLPPIVLLYDVLVRRRSFSESLVRQFVPAVLAVLWILVTIKAQVTIGGGVREHLALNKLEILAVDSVILWKYVGMLICPRDLSVLYDPPTSGIAGQVLISVIGWVLVAGAVWRTRHRYPLVAFAAASALLLMLPVLNLFPLTTLMNDRYLYLPGVAVFAVVSATFAHGLNCFFCMNNRSRCITRRTAAVAVTCCLLLCSGASAVVLGRMTRQQLPVWQNSLTLWQHASKHTPDLPVVRIQLAHALHDQGQFTAAIGELERVRRHRRTDRLDRRRVEQTLSEWKPEAPRQVRPPRGIPATIRIR